MRSSKTARHGSARPGSAGLGMPGARSTDAPSTRSAGSAAPPRAVTGWRWLRLSPSLPQDLAKMSLLGLTYYGTAILSLRLALVRGQVTPIWPPTGIALVALLLFGRRLWPGIALGAFLVNAPISPTPLVAAGIALGNTLAPLLAATALRRIGFRAELARLRDAVALVVLAALLGMAISATGGTASLLLSGALRPGAFWSTWSVWWTGDAMGVLVVAPFLLSLRSRRRGASSSLHRLVEAGILYVGLVLVADLLFHSALHIQYLVFPFLWWAAWRFRQRGAASAALLATGIGVWASVNGWGPFAGATLFHKMVDLQVFNASSAFCSFVLAAILAERHEAIAQRDRAQEELAHRALHDPLTDLANRMLFMDRLGHAEAASSRRSGSVAVMFLDLDRFKAVNDTLGHDVGDRVLVVIAERLRQTMRAGDTASRFGGDEFAVLCEDVADEGEAVGIAERVATAVAQPIVLGAIEVVVTTSIGIALAHGSAARPDALVREADTAMYRAKKRGRNRCQLFEHAGPLVGPATSDGDPIRTLTLPPA